MLIALASRRDAAVRQSRPHRLPGFEHCLRSAVLVDAFRQELSKLGSIEGKNITIEHRFPEENTERVPELAAELVRFKVDLIVASGIPEALAAKKATTNISIVMAASLTPWVQVWLPV